MRQRSAKKEQEMAGRRALIEALQRADLWHCQIGPVLHRAARAEFAFDPGDCAAFLVAAERCQHEPSGIHERLKRSAMGSLTLFSNLLPACSTCNLWVEQEPRLAHLLALVVRPGDHESFLLKHDRGGF